MTTSNMPFRREGDHYVSPSGRKFTKAQVQMYYATEGFSKKPKPKVKRRKPYAKAS